MRGAADSAEGLIMIRLVAEDPDLAGHPLLAEELAREFDPEHADYLEKT